MRFALGLAAGVLTAAVHVTTAFAQSDCRQCRISQTFGGCDSAAMADPPQGAISIAGRVVQVVEKPCGRDLTVDVRRASRPAVPGRVKIEVRSCVFWGGRVGDDIAGMVGDAPATDGAYSASGCN